LGGIQIARPLVTTAAIIGPAGGRKLHRGLRDPGLRLQLAHRAHRGQEPRSRCDPAAACDGCARRAVCGFHSRAVRTAVSQPDKTRHQAAGVSPGRGRGTEPVGKRPRCGGKKATEEAGGTDARSQRTERAWKPVRFRLWSVQQQPSPVLTQLSGRPTEGRENRRPSLSLAPNHVPPAMAHFAHLQRANNHGR
jgi:hypothetical protein